MRQLYNQEVDPPAPFVEVIVANRMIRRKRQTIPALIDTGADFSAIPYSLVEQLALYATGKVYVEDIQLQLIPTFLYGVRVTVADLTIQNLEVITVDFDHAIVGRDLLNRLYLRLDGPELQFELKSGHI